MKTNSTRTARAAWLLLAAPALLANPAFAQDAQTAPPPVRTTVPQSAAPAPVAPAPAAPAAQASPPATTSGSTVSRTTIAPGAADVVDDARQPAARTARAAPARQATRSTATRTTTTTRAPAAAPARVPVAAPAPATPASATVADAPAPAPVTDAPAPAPEAITPAPVADTPADTAATTTTTTNDSGTPLWPIALIAALIIAAGAFFLMRRRRVEEAYEAEPVYYEAEPVAEPVAVERPYVAERDFVAPAAIAAAPIAAAPALERVDATGSPIDEPVVATLAEEPTVSDAPAEDVAALTDGAPPVRNRPWLEFAMRPVRAGTSADEALVEIELTVANSGTVEAHDVRVSTFMLTDANASEMERVMVDAPADASIDPVNIAPGEGTRIDATLAALKSDLGVEGHFNPVIVAEARYRLADGSEGRTAASFVFGVTGIDGGAMTPIDLADRVMRDDIEAQLHGEVEHA